MTEKMYSARELVDLRLESHWLGTDKMSDLVWRINERYGALGRKEMYSLPPLKSMPSVAETDFWETLLREMEERLESDESRKQIIADDVYQLKLPFP